MTAPIQCVSAAASATVVTAVVAASAAAEAALEGVSVTHDRPFSLGGDNFAEYTLKVPGAYAYLGSGNADRPGTRNAAHNGHFDIDEAALPIGAALYASYALWWLGQP